MILRDPAYLKHLRTERCILTGQHATDDLAIDAAHIGTAGRGIKSPDNEALPIRHDLHSAMHAYGEISYLRTHAPDWLLRESFRAYARELYREWCGD